MLNNNFVQNNRFHTWLAGIKGRLLNLLTKSKFQVLRNIYWDFRAKDIYESWGLSDGDFATVESIIQKTGAKKILDIGCGNGRLFTLYRKMNVESVVGQDVSNKALGICGERFPEYSSRLFRGEITALPYESKYFDLVISNRVLSAIPAENLDEVLTKICSLTNYIYLNELSDSDYSGVPSSYWFKHDYTGILTRLGFSIEEQGQINNETWVLYKKE